MILPINTDQVTAQYDDHMQAVTFTPIAGNRHHIHGGTLTRLIENLDIAAQEYHHAHGLIASCGMRDSRAAGRVYEMFLAIAMTSEFLNPNK